MKNKLVLFFILVISYSISAQIGGIPSGKYSYKAKGSKINITVNSPTAAGIVVVDLERINIDLNESKVNKNTKRPSSEFKNSDGILHNIKGLITDRDHGRPLLEFKNSDGILHLEKLTDESHFKNEMGYLRFKSKNSTPSYKYVKGNLSLPGWNKVSLQLL